jgi:peroxiredoxin (alkyl hydroperoxide reductase subunit C)
MEELIAEEKMESHIPRIGDPAPSFEAETTFGLLQLEDFKGNWLVFFSHPADFTPVCTTEFVEFAQKYDEFKKLGVELMGLSIDSIFSHISWIRNIEERFGIKIPFPVVADIDAKVAKRYGMIMPGDSTMETSRCVFVIDPNGKIRAIIYYPLTTGRNVNEILRVVKALQTSDEHTVATPVNWNPGDPVIVPPPRTQKPQRNVREKGLIAKIGIFAKRNSNRGGYTHSICVLPFLVPTSVTTQDFPQRSLSARSNVFPIRNKGYVLRRCF